jgi:hypothetical protein
MKKLLLLSALALLTAAASGCQCGPFGYYCRRGTVTAPAIVDCQPACNSCGDGAVIGDSYLAPPTIVPGPVVQ